jgi:uncharacterized membrane protein
VSCTWQILARLEYCNRILDFQKLIFIGSLFGMMIMMVMMMIMIIISTKLISQAKQNKTHVPQVVNTEQLQHCICTLETWFVSGI